MGLRQTWGYPEKHGLYDPACEKDSCGVGIVAHIKGQRSHQLVLDADHVLRRMAHRGACGCEATTGDGAGILTALPHEFLAKVARDELQAELPARGKYGAGVVFLPTGELEREKCKRVVERIVAEQGQRLVGWRRVPVRGAEADLGPSASAAQPAIEQLFVAAEGGCEDAAFERQLYVIRKRASHELRGDRRLKQASMFYVCSLSSKVIIYKGMLMADQLLLFYPDLADDSYLTHLAMVHSRFSTNTFPSWDRAQPLRCMSHNGEINTLQGNLNWMRAREGVVSGGVFGDDLPKLFPIAEPGCSDSGSFDNVLEFLLMAGRSLPEAMMMMIPEAWQKHDTMPENKRAFYECHSAVMEPWDGPASITFTDGRCVGAVLDRNGLRPSRYYLTHDDRVIMASEVGVLAVEPQNVKAKGRLQPGRMFLIDFEQGRLIPDEELKNDLAGRRPYARWLRENRIELQDLPRRAPPARLDADALLPRLQAFGYTTETLQFMLLPLVQQKRDPLGSMGNDSALACLSDQPRLLYDYFKQLFAQVTNPPIDSIREEIIMSLECYIGPERNLLETTERHCQRLLMPHPILTNEDLAAVKELDYRGWKTRTIDMTFPRAAGPDGMREALLRICAEAAAAIDAGDSLVVLSDRATCAERVPVSSLLACGAVHHYLVREAKRTRIGLVLETGEAREVHHVCLLAGYGADAINPYLAFEAMWRARADGLLDAAEFPDDAKVVSAYRLGVAKGILKVMAKMGISTLQSYKGAQIFEAVGLNREVIDLCFAGTASRIEGVGLKTLAEETLRRHTLGYPRLAGERLPVLPNLGEFHWRAEGERHAWSPDAIANLQVAARTNDRDAYWRFAKLLNDDARARCTLRGLLRFRPGVAGDPVPLEEVEPAADIVKRFCTGAMSFGSISAEAHESLAVAMNRIGGRSNTGEGGEDPARFKPLPNGDSKRSAIKQIASGRFGVTAWYLANADELQIKMAQGAKPGEGGELPGRKVDDNIARIRYSTPGVGLISPPPHHDIYSIEDLAQLIYDLKNANPSARISVKLVSEVGVGTVAAGVAKAHAEHITVSGDTGGTGASPLTSIKHAGLPWELGLAEAHQTLVLNDLRSRVVLQTDGGIRTGRDVVIAALLGAEEMAFATAPLITLGCVMMRKCHLNTCPVGVATQDPVLRRKFSGKPEHVINYLFMVAEEARQIMAQLGFRKMDEMIGRVDCLEPEDAIRHWKTDGLDLKPILAFARRPHDLVSVRRMIPQDHRLDRALDNTHLLKLSARALIRGEAVKIALPILNTHRTVGTILSHEVVKRWGEKGLPDDTIHIKFTGSAGQSFGAFLAGGITLELEGDANDYLGKGLSGGKLIVYPPAESTFAAEDNILVGNVVLYGATDGRAFFRGRAAERFCVRNSGAWAVSEGVGDHGCEYMTGGRAIILGPTGRNFAAGMSGGVAYVWDAAGDFAARCNLGTVKLERVEAEEDIGELLEMIEMHQTYTGSKVAERVLDEWMTIIREQFVKVMPIDYKRVLMDRRAHEEEEETPVREKFAAR
ncbi:MAG: glutamate synthase large subunit [Candidatus Anammoximicrobium sp.]|nr:glutamate synthase large subunit [Candidatus Anammoximicrobium sp.]